MVQTILYEGRASIFELRCQRLYLRALHVGPRSRKYEVQRPMSDVGGAQVLTQEGGAAERKSSTLQLNI